MLDQKNSDLLVEIARNRDTAPTTRISACSLIYRASLLPASEVLGILQETIDDYRCKDGPKVKALDLMDKIDSSRSNETTLTSEQQSAIKEQLLAEYLDVETDTGSGKVQE